MPAKHSHLIPGWPDHGYYYFNHVYPFSMATNFYGGFLLFDHRLKRNHSNSQIPHPIPSRVLDKQSIWRESNSSQETEWITCYENRSQEEDLKDLGPKTVKFDSWTKDEDSHYYYWFAFLKLNPDYEELCRILRQYPDQAPFIWPGGGNPRDPWHKELKDKKVFKEGFSELINTYHLFGDVHADKYGDDDGRGFFRWWNDRVSIIDDGVMREHSDSWMDMLIRGDGEGNDCAVICRGSYLFANWGRANNLRLLTNEELDINKGASKEGVYHVQIDTNLALTEIEFQLDELMCAIKDKTKGVDRPPLLRFRQGKITPPKLMSQWLKAYRLKEEGKTHMQIGYVLNDTYSRHTKKGSPIAQIAAAAGLPEIPCNKSIKKTLPDHAETLTTRGSRAVRSANLNIDESTHIYFESPKNSPSYFQGKFPAPLCPAKETS
jgi:hypothetical protein